MYLSLWPRARTRWAWLGLLLATAGCVELSQSVELLPDGRVLVTLDYAAIAEEELFPIEPWQPEVDGERVDGALFLAGGRRLLVWRRWGRVAHFDTASRELLAKATISPLELALESPDGELVATLDKRSGAVTILSLPGLEEVERFDVAALLRYGPGLSWSPDGRWLIGHDVRGIYWVLDMQTGEQRPDLEQVGTVWGWVPAPEGSRLVLVVGERIVAQALVADSPSIEVGKVWKMLVGPSGELAVLAQEEVLMGDGASLALSPVTLPWPARGLSSEGNRLLAFGHGRVAVLDWEGRVLHEVELDPDLAPVLDWSGGVAATKEYEADWLTTLSRDGRRLAHCVIQRHGGVIDLEAAGGAAHKPIPLDAWKIGTCVFGPAGRTVLVNQGVGTILFWPLDGSREIVPMPGEHAKYTGRSNLADDGAPMFNLDPDKLVDVWRWAEIQALLEEPTIWDRLPPGVFRPAHDSHVLDMHALRRLIAWRSHQACGPEGYFMGDEEYWASRDLLEGGGAKLVSLDVTLDGALCRQRAVLEFHSVRAYNRHADTLQGARPTASALLGARGMVAGTLRESWGVIGPWVLRILPRGPDIVAEQFASGCVMTRVQCDQFLGFPIRFRLKAPGYGLPPGSDAYMEDGWAVWETTLGDWLTLEPMLTK